MTKFAPNSFKEKLLQEGLPHAAMLLDILWLTGLISWDSFGVVNILAELRDKHIQTSESLVRRGIAQLSRLGLLAYRPVFSKQRGRPEIVYRLASMDAICRTLGVKLHEQEAHDEVSTIGFSSVRAYRAGLHRSFIKRVPGAYSRMWLGARLGVTKRTTANYEKDSDIQVTERLERHRLELDDIPLMPKKRQIGAIFLLVEYERPMTIEEKDTAFHWVAPNWREIMNPVKTVREYLPLTAFMLRRELAKGHRCYKAWQTTNYYECVA